MKKHTPNEQKQHTRENTKPGKAPTASEAITAAGKASNPGNAASIRRNDAGTMENSRNHATNAQKARHATKRPQADQIPAEAIKRHTGPHRAPADKRRTPGPSLCGIPRKWHLYSDFSMGSPYILLKFAFSDLGQTYTPGG